MAALDKLAPVNLLKTSFIVYYHQNLSKARTFLLDFGLRVVQETDDEIFFAGYGIETFCYVVRASKRAESYFGGAAYTVESREQLERAAKVPGASEIRTLVAPGGGEIVTLVDPAGHNVHLVHGQREKPEEIGHLGLQKLTVNYEDEKPRRGTFQRFKPGPAPVHRFGHYGVTYPDGLFETMLEWYTKTLTLAVSDIIYVGEKPVTAFLHVDRGEEFTDHHSFFFKRAKSDKHLSVAHAAFEVHDYDVQQLGHDFLKSRGYNLCWGIGRHVLGSQIFDYWFDPHEFIVEHYADGDVVNSKTPVSHAQAGPDALSVWGPEVPEVF